MRSTSIHEPESVAVRPPGPAAATGVTRPVMPVLPAHAARAVGLIRAEHRAIAGMVSAMRALLVRDRGAGGKQDFTLFEAMLAYVENVPDHVHHPKEDAVLFPALVRRALEAKQLVDALELDHRRGRVMLASLHDALGACRDGAIGGLDRLTRRVDEFASFYDEHMWQEEQQLLPLAVAHLAPEEWQCVERAFGENAVGSTAELAADYRRLYQCIAEVMPPPLGSYLLGEMPRSSGR